MKFTEDEIKLVEYFANKYMRMAIEVRAHHGKGGFAMAHSLDRQSKNAQQLANKMRQLNQE
jgi:hypothetical protein